MNFSPKEIEDLNKKTKVIRRLIVEMIAKAGSGHPGGSLSSSEILTALYFKILRHDPKKPNWSERDRFHLSKGHCCPLWYACLAESGYFDVEELQNLRKFKSMLQGHPDRRTPGVNVASGSLGQGLSVSLGMSLAGKLDKASYRVYCLLGDGEIQEGNIWEAAMAAAHYKCDNLCAILDYNGFQIDGCVKDVMNLEPLKDKWVSFGWYVIEIDGHNMKEILSAFVKAETVKGKPTIIIAKTTKGNGVSFMENAVDFHCRAPTKDETEQALKELE